MASSAIGATAHEANPRGDEPGRGSGGLTTPGGWIWSSGAGTTAATASAAASRADAATRAKLYIFVGWAGLGCEAVSRCRWGKMGLGGLCQSSSPRVIFTSV